MSDDADDNTDDDVLSITEKRSIVAQFCLGTCKPWRNIDDLSASSTTWYNAYLAYMSSTNHTLPLANRILTHSQEYYIGKEEGKHEQAENRGLIQEDSNPNVDEENNNIKIIKQVSPAFSWAPSGTLQIRTWKWRKKTWSTSSFGSEV